MEEQQTEYILSKEEKEEVDELLQELSTPSTSHSDDLKKKKAARTFAYKLFSPWKQARTKSVRTYFEEKNGLKILIDGFKMFTDLRVQRYLASACWCYGETVDNRKALVEAGALPIIISLAKNPDQDVSDTALGWMWGILEIEELLDYFAAEGVPQLLVEKVLPHSIEGFELVLKERNRIVGCMQCLAVNKNCRKLMVPALDKLLSVIEHDMYYFYLDLLTHDVVLGLVHIAVFAAYMTIDDVPDPMMENGYRYRERICKALELVMKNITVQAVAEGEEKNIYVWHNMLAFLPLIETDLIVVRRFGAFVMAYLSKSDRTRDLMIQQNIVSRIQMLSYSPDLDTQHYATTALSHFKTKMNMPSLITWCYWHLILSRGVSETKKILAEKHVSY